MNLEIFQIWHHSDGSEKEVFGQPITMACIKIHQFRRFDPLIEEYVPQIFCERIGSADREAPVMKRSTN